MKAVILLVLSVALLAANASYVPSNINALAFESVLNDVVYTATTVLIKFHQMDLNFNILNVKSWNVDLKVLLFKTPRITIEDGGTKSTTSRFFNSEMTSQSRVEYKSLIMVTPLRAVGTIDGTIFDQEGELAVHLTDFDGKLSVGASYEGNSSVTLTSIDVDFLYTISARGVNMTGFDFGGVSPNEITYLLTEELRNEFKRLRQNMKDGLPLFLNQMNQKISGKSIRQIYLDSRCAQNGSNPFYF